MQECSSPSMFGLVGVFDYALLGCLLVGGLVGFMLLVIIFSRFTSLYVWEGHVLEVVWTVIPIIVLAMLAFPSLRLLYVMDELISPKTTLKVTGHQWYWSYEYDSYEDAGYDSYMLPSDSLEFGDFRLLDVDHRAVLPVDVSIRSLITSADVLHSWAVPSLGVKVDAVPGRLSQLPMKILSSGVYYGQCSEICGANHAFMPVVVEAVSVSSYLSFVNHFGSDG